MNKQVACDLSLSEITVKIHRGAAKRKMGARTLADLSGWLKHCGWVRQENLDPGIVARR
jgi:FixJ family two-component response regulator